MATNEELASALLAECRANECREVLRLQAIKEEKICRGRNFTPLINWRIMRAAKRVNLLLGKP